MVKSHQQHANSALKRRSIYLARVAQAQALAGVGLTIATIFGSVTLLVAFIGLLTVPVGGVSLGIIIFLACVCTIAAGGWKLRQRAVERAKSIPYVPPVREQIAALPADEILVRGSDQPPAIQDELLRSAQQTEVNSPDELLRAHLHR